MQVIDNGRALSGKQQRIAERRGQIIAAARICFRRHGFHGAGMAEIASLSQLSVGQIYRYFVNKEAIIEEIVHRIVKHRIQLMLDNGNELSRMADDLTNDGLLDGADADINQGLMLEIAAEATRNPRVARILCEADAMLYRQGCEMLQRVYPQMSADRAAVLAEMMAVLCEGTALRVLTHQQKTDRAQLYQLYMRIFTTVFPSGPADG
ncbi:TetR/AcrR family transcriptional regulator [Acerihabitans arboris]|uniref:TetR family transcriptional regulator n=1 Tax=Acerihabitans arboris TaxID=2691583 RepID=A0A845SID2_9GAMM|nr:TetR/AcrR family transcriptional regulator [Acerihabitans arboris]NDL63689.1 TetR family transcriptional regulator [Acerihabitans arboris]